VPLTLRQRRALEVFDWLYDPRSRGTGRSTALAIGLVREALRRPGFTLPFLEQGLGRDDTQQLILKWLREDPVLRILPWARDSRSFRLVEVPESIEIDPNWEPSLEGEPPEPTEEPSTSWERLLDDSV
jgi:hypothetical protein